MQNYTLEWGVSPMVLSYTGSKQVIWIPSHRVEGMVSVPEPSEYALVAGLGLLGLVLWRRRS